MLILRFDLRLAPRSPASHQELMEAAIDMAAWGETHGALAIAFSEHHSSPDGYLASPLLMAASTAARTSSVQITVAALLLLMYDPVKLAEDMIVLDHLSQGRVSYTIGLGYRDEEYAMFGIDRTRRATLIEERIDVLRRALAGEHFQWDGRTIHVTPEPLTPGGPSIAYGGGSEAAARRAARLGMMFIAETAEPALVSAYDDEARRTGNPTGLAMVPEAKSATSLFVAADLDAAWEQLGEYLLWDALTYAAWLGPNNRAASWSGASSVAELRAEEGSYRIVTPDEAVEIIARQGRLALQPLCGGIPPQLAWQSLKLIETDVLPMV